jgi:hypothetical protein
MAAEIVVGPVRRGRAASERRIERIRRVTCLASVAEGASLTHRRQRVVRSAARTVRPFETAELRRVAGACGGAARQIGEDVARRARGARPADALGAGDAGVPPAGRGGAGGDRRRLGRNGRGAPGDTEPRREGGEPPPRRRRGLGGIGRSLGRRRCLRRGLRPRGLAGNGGAPRLDGHRPMDGGRRRGLRGRRRCRRRTMGGHEPPSSTRRAGERGTARDGGLPAGSRAACVRAAVQMRRSATTAPMTRCSRCGVCVAAKRSRGPAPLRYSGASQPGPTPLRATDRDRAAAASPRAARGRAPGAARRCGARSPRTPRPAARPGTRR